MALGALHSRFCGLWKALRPHVCRAGWYTAAYVTGGYGAAAQGRNVRAAAVAAAKAWALGITVSYGNYRRVILCLFRCQDTGQCTGVAPCSVAKPEQHQMSTTCSEPMLHTSMLAAL